MQLWPIKDIFTMALMSVAFPLLQLSQPPPRIKSLIENIGSTGMNPS
jgi:hypothetical protein